MFSWQLVKFFIYLSLPWFAKKIINWLKGPSSKGAADKKIQEEPLALWEKAVIVGSLAYVFYQLFMGLFWIHKANYFFNFGIQSFDLPGYMIRSRMREYVNHMTELYPEQMKEMLECRSSEQCSLTQLSSCKKLAWLERPFLRYSYLTDQLVNANERKLYIKHGEDAFLQCSYCKEDYDYSVYNIIGMALSYLSFLFVAKNLCMIRNKAGWFNFAVIYAVCIGAHELYQYLGPYHDLSMYDGLFGKWRAKISLKLEKVETIRRIFFAIGTLIVSCFDRKSGAFLTKVIAINRQLEGCLKRANLLRMQRVAVNQDSALGKFQNDQVARRERLRESVYLDDEFSKYKKEVMANSGSLLDEYCGQVNASLDEFEREAKLERERMLSEQ